MEHVLGGFSHICNARSQINMELSQNFTRKQGNAFNWACAFNMNHMVYGEHHGVCIVEISVEFVTKANFFHLPGHYLTIYMFAV